MPKISAACDKNWRLTTKIVTFYLFSTENIPDLYRFKLAYGLLKGNRGKKRPLPQTGETNEIDEND